MAQYVDRLARPSLTPLTSEDMEQLASQKAHELFAVCDKEQKGFITKRDMQRLQSELPLDPDQLEAVFDSLDDDKNGYLTLEEFTEGFGMFLGINPEDGAGGAQEEGLESVYEEEEDPQEEEKMFQNMMESMGANRVFEDDATLKLLWTKIRHDEPELMPNFEEFLYKVTNDIRRSKIDFDSLETALRSKTTAHDEEVRKLYEEMEFQIKSEKEKILLEEKSKEKQMREAMENELIDKDKQLQELIQKHQEMEARMKELNLCETETRQENEKLMKEKETLQDMLIRSEEGLEESKSYINQLRNQQKNEKRERARAAIKLTENIALERESLVKQLDLLKDVNKKLRDDQDEAETRRTTTADSDSTENLHQILESEAKGKPKKRKELCKQGSILGNYFPTNRGRFESTQESISEGEDDISVKNSTINNNDVENLDDFVDDDDDIECDDDDMYIESDGHFVNNINNHESCENVEKGGYVNTCHKNGGDGLGMKENLTGSSRGDGQKSEEFTSSDGENEDRRKNRARQSDRQKKHHKKVRKKVSKSQVPSLVTVNENSLNISEDYEEISENIDIQLASSFEEICDPQLRRNSILVETSLETLGAMSDTNYETANILEDTERMDSQKGEITPSVLAYAKSRKSDVKYSSAHPKSKKHFPPKEKLQTKIIKHDDNDDNAPSSPRGQPVGAVDEEENGEESTVAMRQRIFKVVFVGDSGVGKSSFIHRFCNDHFNPTFSATIGVDFQVKSQVIDGQVIVLQLWDTAGQERFRSITKQYFRKADGVIVMYDITSENSFKNVRNWMTSVQDGVEEGTAVVILGNKTDTCVEEEKRSVKTKDGLKLCLEFDGIFYETSAKTGSNVKEAMDALAKVLKEKEDRELEKSLNLEDPVKKKGCCGR